MASSDVVIGAVLVVLVIENILTHRVLRMVMPCLKSAAHHVVNGHVRQLQVHNVRILQPTHLNIVADSYDTCGHLGVDVILRYTSK